MKLIAKATGLGKKLTLITAAFVLAVSSLTAAVPFVLAKNASAATVTVVKPSNTQGWVGADDNGNGGTVEYVAGPVAVPSGAGSAQLAVSAANQGYLLAKSAYGGVKLADLTALSYSTYVQQGNNTIAPALQFNVVANVETDTNWQGRIVYEPYQTSQVLDGMWQSHNALAGKWWFSRPASFAGNCAQSSPCTLEQIETLYPNAGVSTSQPLVAFKAGSGWNTPFVGNVDRFVIVSNTVNDIYDFEPSLPDTQKPTIALTSPTSNVFAAGTDLVFAASDNEGLGKIVANVYKTGVNGVFKPAQTNAAGASTGSLVVSTAGFANGSYSVRYNALDTSNNLSTTQTFSFTIDNTKPVITVKGSAWGNAYAPASTGSGNVFKEVNFKLFDNDKVKTAYVNGAQKSLTAAQWSDVNGVRVGALGGQYGNNTFRVLDQAGNESSYDFVLDNVAPTVTVKASPDTIGVSPYQKVSFKLYDQYKVARAEVNGFPIELSDSQWSDLNNLVPGGSMRGVAGANTVKVWDVAGNVTEVNFVLDVTAPSASFLFSNNNGNAVTNQDVTVTMNTTEPIQTPADWTKVTDTQFTRVYSANGKFNVAITDFAGNAAIKNYEVKRIDKQAPVVIASGANGLAGFRGDVNITVTDQNFSKLYVGGTQVSAPSAGGWDYALANALSGNGTYAIKATDKGGNETNLTIVIDNSFFSTINVSAFDSETPTVSGVLSYKADGATIADAELVVSVDGVPLFYPITNPDGSWSTPIEVTDGNHTVSVSRVNDDASLTQVANYSFTTTLPAPEVPEAETPPVGGGDNEGEEPTEGAPIGEEESEGGATPASPLATPAAINPSAFAGVLGTGTTDNTETGTDNTDGEAVEGASTEDILAQAVDANNTDGKALGLAWYWWLLIIAGGAAGIWWLIAALRGRSAE